MHCSYRMGAVIITVLLGSSYAPAQLGHPAGERGLATQITAAGTVIDSQGRPVEGARVTLYRLVYTEAEVSLPKVEIIQEGSTARNGMFTLHSQDGDSYRPEAVVAQKKGLGLGWAMWQAGTDRRFEIMLSEAEDLRGDVVDEKGQPIADVEVGISFGMMGKGGDWRILTLPSFLDTRTDKTGRFVFADMPAEATFELRARKAGRVTVDTTLVQATFGDFSPTPDVPRKGSGGIRLQFSPGQTGIKLVLPPAAIVEGIVVDKASGKPVGGVKVAAGMEQMADGFLPPDPVSTAEDGTFRIGGLAAGRRTVQSAMPREQVAEWVAEPVQVSLKAGETRNGIKLELTKGGIIEVLVKGSAGKPVAQASVTAQAMQGNQLVRGTTDENGLARIRVPSGQYRVSEPFRLGYGRQIREEQVTIGEGETKRVEFIL
ncbi:MAG: carboxypeptidase-like regulatory domain-containing protein [Planctomycetes bacterium]|nr:carboxypeptidase-like regulatory domain-containing protein [Planctomycetota bacterium]